MKYRIEMPRLRPVLIAYVIVGIALWPLPLLQILHVESAAVMAGVAFFAAGLNAFRWFEAGASPGSVVRAQVAALSVPLTLSSVSLLWAPNCGYAQGLMFFGLFPVISVVLAVGLASALHSTRRPRLYFCLLGLAILVAGPVYDLGLHPQFYSYNHVFGGILGPIYDEELAVRPGLFAFRGLSLLWAGLFFLVGRVRSEYRRRLSGLREGGRPPYVLVVCVSVLIGLAYLFSGPLGINTPADYLQRKLGAVYRTAHFDIFYDPASLDRLAVRRLGTDHEYRYARLSERLDVEVPGRIASYLYPDVETRAALTGARNTNIAPVWLARPQVHVLQGAYAQVFPHELAHVFSRAFGLPVLHASLSVGLVEGFAVAMEPPDGLPSPDDQVLSVARRRGGTDGLARSVAARLSPVGFWTRRGAVSYTTMGSFVGFIIERYGAQAFERVYAQGDFHAVYGKSEADLAAEWVDHLRSVTVVSRASGPLARRRFAVPSLFETRCPHYLPPFIRIYREGNRALAAGDTVRALEQWEAALALHPRYVPALDAWARTRLAQGAPADVVARLDTLDASRRSPVLGLRLADALALRHQPERARGILEETRLALSLFATETAAWILLRTALVEQPEITRILVSGDSSAQKAARMSPFDGPEARIISALLWDAGDRPEAALSRMSGVPPISMENPAAERLLARQRLAWLALFRYHAGDVAGARDAARQAVRGFRDVGDFDGADRMRDFAAGMAWIGNGQ